MTDMELLELAINVGKEIHKRACHIGRQLYKDNPNNVWKLTRNLKALKDMGRMDLYQQVLDRQKAIKEADAACFKKHGRYITQEEFERGDF